MRWLRAACDPASWQLPRQEEVTGILPRLGGVEQLSFLRAERTLPPKRPGFAKRAELLHSD